MVVPADWKEFRLGEICEIYQPTTIGGKDFKESGEFVVYGANGPIGRYNRYNHEDPEVTVTCRGATCGTVNVTPPRVWITGNAMVVRPKAQTLSKLMLKYILQALDYSDVITGAAQPQITGAGLSPCQILVPPLKEQEAIAEALSDADSAIESLDSLIAKKRDVKQAAMQQLLTGRTRLPGFTADWKEVRLGEHAAFFKGNGLSKSQLIDDGPQHCVHYGELFTHYGPVIETVTSKCVAFEGSFKSLAGDVLMPGSDVTPRGLATASAIKVSDVVLGGDVIVIRTKPTSLYGPFLSNFIRMSKGRVLRLVKGSTVYHIHAKDLADLEVLMPSLNEQEAIAEALSVMDNELEALTEQVSKLQMVKDGMMQDLLTGKVRLV